MEVERLVSLRMSLEHEKRSFEIKFYDKQSECESLKQKFAALTTSHQERENVYNELKSEHESLVKLFTYQTTEMTSLQ